VLADDHAVVRTGLKPVLAGAREVQIMLGAAGLASRYPSHVSLGAPVIDVPGEVDSLDHARRVTSGNVCTLITLLD
jgi:hypothetical protein